MSAQNVNEIRAALARGDINPAQAVGITIEEEAILAQQGYELMKEGKLHDAEKIFDGLALLNPQNSYYFTALGNIKKAMEMPEQAAEQFELAVKANPNDLVALMSLADLHLRQKDKNAALPRLLQILFIDDKKRSEQAREAENILKKLFTKDEIKAYVEGEMAKLPKK